MSNIYVNAMKGAVFMGVVGGIFGRNSEVLFFILVFLLLFWNGWFAGTDC